MIATRIKKAPIIITGSFRPLFFENIPRDLVILGKEMFCKIPIIPEYVVIIFCWIFESFFSSV